MRKLALSLSAAIVGICALGYTTALTAGESAKATAAVGKAAPTFTLKDQSGNAVNLADLKGKIVVLEWFNNECPFVVKHYKNGDMNSTATKLKGDDVVWLAIDSSASHDAANSKTVAADWKIDRPILTDASGEVGKQYGAKTTPHMYVIDKDGTLAYAGAIDDNKSSNPEDAKTAKNYVAAAVAELREGKAVTTSQTQPYGCSVKYKN